MKLLLLTTDRKTTPVHTSHSHTSQQWS